MKHLSLFLLFVLGFPLNAADNDEKVVTFSDVYKAQMKIVSLSRKDEVQFSLDEVVFFAKTLVTSQQDADNLAMKFFINEIRNLKISTMKITDSKYREELIEKMLDSYGFLNSDYLNYYTASFENSYLPSKIATELLYDLKDWIDNAIESQKKIAHFVGVFEDPRLQRIASSELLTDNDIAFLKANPDIANGLDPHGNNLIAVLSAHGRTSSLKKIREAKLNLEWDKTNNHGLTGFYLSFLRIFGETHDYLSSKGMKVFYTDPDWDEKTGKYLPEFKKQDEENLLTGL